MENAAAYTRRLLRKGARAHKSLGQNFLMDDQVISEIIGASILGPEIPLVEIGPGLGVLTRLLAREVKQLWAVELDQSKVELLREELKGLPVEIVVMDALKLSLKELWGERRGYLVGNLPYYITSPLLMHFLEQQESLFGMTVMVQKEVADRIVAQPGSKEYGILSIAVQVAAEPEKICDVPPQAFWPAPKVFSTVMRLNLRPYPGLNVDPRDFFRVVKAAFSQRRKTLGNSLAAGLGFEKKALAEILKKAGIEEQRRAETLCIAEYQELTKVLYEVL